MTPTSGTGVGTAAGADEVWAVVRRSLVLVQVGLVLASLAVPLLASGTESDDRAERTAYGLVAGLGLYLGSPIDDFGDPEDRPFGIPGGVTLTRIGLLVLLVSLVVAAIATLAMAFERSGRAVRIVGRVAGDVLIGSALLVAIGQQWLSSDRVGTAPQPGLLVPLTAGVWLLSLCAAKRALDGVDGAWSGS